MKQLIIGTRNPGKFREIKAILGRVPWRLVPLSRLRGVPSVAETGRTYLANARQKARAVVQATKRSPVRGATGLPVLVEDSGLEVAALGNRPGIRSARYAGPQATAEANNRKLLSELASVSLSRRNARYRCVAILMLPDGKEYIREGICAGRIALAPKGRKGFGYDPLFIPRGYGKTFGELPERLKNRLSHRAQALRKLIPFLRNAGRDFKTIKTRKAIK